MEHLEHQERKETTINIIEGNIAVGKSTLARRIKKMFGNRVKIVIEPSINNKYLQDFYKDPKKYAFILQMYLHRIREAAYKEAIELSKSGKVHVFLDRSIYSDEVFAKVNKVNMNDEQWSSYLKHRNAVLKDYEHPPDNFIYLDVPVSKCMERIHRRGIECEKTIPEDYLKALDKEYKNREWMDKMRLFAKNTHILDWSNYGEGTNINEILTNIVKI